MLNIFDFLLTNNIYRLNRIKIQKKPDDKSDFLRTKKVSENFFKSCNQLED